MSQKSLKKILIVDDEEAFPEAISRLLKREGYDTDIHTDGKCALNAIETQKRNNTPYSLILTDIHMPNIDGIKLIHKVHKINNIPIAAITGYSNLEHMADVVNNGNVYFQKTDVDEILKFVREKLGPTNEIIPASYSSKSSNILVIGSWLGRNNKTSNLIQELERNNLNVIKAENINVASEKILSSNSIDALVLSSVEQYSSIVPEKFLFEFRKTFPSIPVITDAKLIPPSKIHKLILKGGLYITASEDNDDWIHAMSANIETALEWEYKTFINMPERNLRPSIWAITGPRCAGKSMITLGVQNALKGLISVPERYRARKGRNNEDLSSQYLVNHEFFSNSLKEMAITFQHYKGYEVGLKKEQFEGLEQGRDIIAVIANPTVLKYAQNELSKQLNANVKTVLLLPPFETILKRAETCKREYSQEDSKLHYDAFVKLKTEVDIIISTATTESNTFNGLPERIFNAYQSVREFSDYIKKERYK